MMPWGRERLAEGEYDKALCELKKDHPNNQKVLWHLDCATNLNPSFREAIELKERVTGRSLTSVDNSSIRTFVREMVLADREPGTIPPPPPVNKTVDPNAGKPANPTASAATADEMDDYEDQFADADPETLPVDQQQQDGAAESDVVWADQPPAATTRPAKGAGAVAATQPTTRPTLAGQKRDEKGDAPAAARKPEELGAPGTVTVTELPTEEVKPDAPATDDNK
jgi:hypothetical protein